ncbi:uncharacterized protein LOC142588833 [Dermacentor variabilis]|uniref:uncharacterized protein LOC142588833 n=1 Tax=Dermacentor variabilis TaxID=34621 RepID=UPI003F5BBD2E
MAGATVNFIEGTEEHPGQRSEESPSAEVRQPSPSQDQTDLDARLRNAITVGVVTMVILTLFAMAYSFNEAQRQLDYLQDSDHVKPNDLEEAWRMASNSTHSAATTTDDLDIVSLSTEADGDNKWLPSTAEAKSAGDGSKETDDEDTKLKRGRHSD